MTGPQLRMAVPGDAAAIASIYAPIVAATSISFEVDPPGVAEIERRMIAAAQRWPWLVVDDGNILGYAYASEHRMRAAYRWSADVSVYVAERGRRAGVGARLYRALLAILGEQGFYNAFAGITLPNEPSIALHRALDFAFVGSYKNVGFKFGAWRDVSWWQRELRAPAEPDEPLPLAAIHARVAQLLRV